MEKITFETKNALGIAPLNNPPVNTIDLDLVDDLQNVLSENSVTSFLKDGPGKITFKNE